MQPQNPDPVPTPQAAPSEAPAPVAPAQPPKQKRILFKVALGVFILNCFIFVALAAYYLGTKRAKSQTPAPSGAPAVATPTPTPISMQPSTEQQTYVDLTKGFSFEYPSGWKITKSDREGDLKLSSQGSEIYIVLNSNPNNLSIQALYDTYNDTSRFWFQQFEYENLTSPLDGVRFPLIQETGQDNKRTDYIYKLIGSVIDFSYTYTEPQLLDQFEKIAKSVKAVNLSDALSYSNTQYGFSFNLPRTWQNFTVSTEEGSPRIVRLSVPTPFTGSLPVSSLSVYIFTPEEWNALAKKPEYLAQDNNYVFATDKYISSSDECVQLDAFQCARALELSSIFSTFEVN